MRVLGVGHPKARAALTISGGDLTTSSRGFGTLDLRVIALAAFQTYRSHEVFFVIRLSRVTVGPGADLAQYTIAPARLHFH
jgi:hypothetical protein